MTRKRIASAFDLCRMYGYTFERMFKRKDTSLNHRGTIIRLCEHLERDDLPYDNVQILGYFTSAKDTLVVVFKKNTGEDYPRNLDTSIRAECLRLI